MKNVARRRRARAGAARRGWATLFVCQPRWDPLPILQPLAARFPTQLPPWSRGRAVDVAAGCTCASGKVNVRDSLCTGSVYVLHLTNITPMCARVCTRYTLDSVSTGYAANT